MCVCVCQSVSVGPAVHVCLYVCLCVHVCLRVGRLSLFHQQQQRSDGQTVGHEGSLLNASTAGQSGLVVIVGVA